MAPFTNRLTHRRDKTDEDLILQDEVVSRLVLLLAAVLSLVFIGMTAAYSQSGRGQNPPPLKNEQIDQIIAPIALYPDDLLAQVLMASAYPLEIVEAARWQKTNANLTGEALAQAMEDQSWDPSVKSIVPFPQILDMMSEKLDWTQKIGDALQAQQKDVMASVQRLRHLARNTGKLQSSPQQRVEVQQEDIIIQPTEPQTVYVPAYDPAVVYGTWPYPAYPPYYYPPPAYYPGAALAAGVAFAAGVAITASIWGWGHCNWGGGNVNVNVNRFNNINVNNIRAGRATAINNNNWRRDTARAGGNRNFAGRTNAASRQLFRGYDNHGGAQGNRGAAANNGRLGGNGAGQRQTGRGTSSSSGLNRSSAFGGMNSGFNAHQQSQRGMQARQSFSGGGGRNFGGGGFAGRTGSGGRIGGGGRRR